MIFVTILLFVGLFVSFHSIVWDSFLVLYVFIILVTTTSTTLMTSADDVNYLDRDVHVHDGYVPNFSSRREYQMVPEFHI